MHLLLSHILGHSNQLGENSWQMFFIHSTFALKCKKSTRFPVIWATVVRMKSLNEVHNHFSGLFDDLFNQICYQNNCYIVDKSTKDDNKDVQLPRERSKGLGKEFIYQALASCVFSASFFFLPDVSSLNTAS